MTEVNSVQTTQLALRPSVYFVEKTTRSEDRVRVGDHLVYEPDRAHDKFRSSGLFVSGNWSAEDATANTVVGQVPEDLMKAVCITSIPEGLFVALRDWAHLQDGTGLPNAMERSIRDSLGDFIGSATRSRRPIDVMAEAIVLRSDPLAGTSSGLTTNGLHFDDPRPASIRIGVNLGIVDRNIYFVPALRRSVSGSDDCDESGGGYGGLPHSNLRPISVLVKAGESWTMPTTNFLHDGRRAVPTGPSSFLLATGVFK
jgi:hypothetical protein